MQRLAGFVLIFISAISFGTLPIFARFAYAAGADPITVLFLRFTAATLVMAVWMLARRIPLPRGQTLLGLMAMGAVGYVGQSMCYFNALLYASASLVSLLLYLYPVLVAGLAALFLKERLTKWSLAALALALVGATLTIGVVGGGKAAGIALSLGAAGIYSVYIVSGSRLMKIVPPIPASTVIMASAGVVYGGLVTVGGPQWPQSAQGWLAVGGIALVATVIAIVTFFAGLERVGPTAASTLSTLEPVTTVLLATVLLGERLGWLQLLGGGLILAAVIVLTRGEIEQAAVAAAGGGEAGGEQASDAASPGRVVYNSELFLTKSNTSPMWANARAVTVSAAP